MQYFGHLCILYIVRHNDLDIDNYTIIEECRNGNREAMSMLYTRFAPRMMHVISRYVSNKDDARDVLHDGFIAAYTRLDSLRDSERLEFWLATIMKNLSLKMLQSQNVASILEEIPATEEYAEPDEDLDFDTIESLIRQLPDGYQKVFRLAVLENKSHKEISQILGIAPNSSSSQLFHAKLMMRKLIKDYQQSVAILTLLLVVATASTLIFFKYLSKENETGSLMSVDTSTEKTILKSSAPEAPKNHTPIAVGSNNPVPFSSSSISSSILASASGSSVALPTISIEDSDSIESKIENTAELPTIEEPQMIAEASKDDEILKTAKKDSIFYHIESPLDNDLFYAQLQKKHKRSKGWSAGIAFNSGTALQGITSMDGLGNHDNIFDDLWGSQLNPNDPETKPDDNDTDPQIQTRSGADDSLDKLDGQSCTYHLPITIEVTAEKHFTSWLGLESGISYTYLRTDFEGYSDKTICQWHYLELPLKVNLYAYDSSRFAIYGSVGGRFAIPIHSWASIHNKGNKGDSAMSFKSYSRWSVGGSIGFSYHLSKRVNLYIEPTLQYHFPHEYKVRNIWDDERWHFSLPIGVRFNW